MQRLSSLEALLEDFETSPTANSVGYFIQVRPRSVASALPNTPESINEDLLAKNLNEPIYLSDGKPNTPFLMRNADLLFEAGDYSLALAMYSVIAKDGREPHSLLTRIAKCLEAQGELEKACQKFEEAITFVPTVESYQHLSAILTRQGKNEQAAQVLERALNLKTLNNDLKFEIHKSCGNAWTRATKTSEAENHYNQALAISPNSDEIKSNLGTLYLQAGQYGEAKRFFRDAQALNPRNALAISGLGSCSLAEGDKLGALDYFASSLSIELNNPTGIFYLVKCAFETKSYAKACRILENYMEIVPINSSLLYSLAGLRFHLGRFDKAKEVLLKILELQPQHCGANELLEMVEKYSGTSN
ncbi:unnamed protein product [Sphagnum tenellum]